MSENSETMDRRNFLVKSGSLLFGTLIGFNSFSDALAFEEPRTIQPRISLIIDDIGFSLSRARRFLELRIPITFSILPRLSRSHDLAYEIHEKGHEIMLHQPMEPYNSVLDPGPGALYVGYDSEKIAGIMEENISGVPFLAGVNNHMGSRLTESQREINETLEVIKKKRLFFIDSVTTRHSTAYKTARKLNMVTAFRNIFLDNRPDEQTILFQLKRLEKIARKIGHAIGIGHPFPETAKAIGRFARNLDGSGISIVHISKIIHS